jgi:secreted trypsin-like serine protease
MNGPRKLALVHAQAAILLCGAGLSGVGCGIQQEPDKVEKVTSPIWGNPALPDSAYNASPGEYPWMALISIPTNAKGYAPGGTNLTPECGGSLIAPNWVLTAAHCLYADQVDANGNDIPFVQINQSDFQVTLGEYDRSVSPDPGAPPEQIRHVVGILHKDFVVDTVANGGFLNDVALLKLDTPVTLNDRVKLVRLASGGDGTGTPAWISGWGWTDASLHAASTILREAYTPVESNADCTTFLHYFPEFPTTYRDLNANELCAQQVNGGDPTQPPLDAATCFGDSGGPLVTTRPSGCQEEIGVVSWGHLSCEAITVYAKVSSHIDWIRQNVPSINGGTTYEAETMTHVGGTTYQDGWNIFDNNSYAAFTHTFHGGQQQMIVSAAGQFAGGAWPNMQIRVNGNVVYNTTVNTGTWANYTFTFNAPVGAAEVRVYFTNDFYQPPADRNLFLDKVTVTGSDTCPPPASALTATFVPGNDWGSGYCETISVTNTASVPTTNWSATVNIGDGHIYTSWNGNFSASTGTFTVTPTIPSSKTVAPGATDQTVGFCVNRGPSGFKPTNANLTASGSY